MSLVIYKSKRKAIWILIAGILLLAGGLLFMFLANDMVSGWILMISAVMCVLLGVGQLADRKPQIVITENGITDLIVIREEIEWDAIAYVDDFWYRGQNIVRILLPRDYNTELIRSTWFRRLDQIYAREDLKAMYIRTGGLDVSSIYLTAVIRKMAKTDRDQRADVLRNYRLSQI